MCTSVYFTYQNNAIEVVNVELSYQDLAYDYKGLTIVQVSDLHLPRNASSIDRIVDMIDSINPDIIMLTGDLIDSKYDFDRGDLQDFSSRISSIADTYCVIGNHEGMSGYLNYYITIMQDNNITVLRNEYAVCSYNDKDILILGLK